MKNYLNLIQELSLAQRIKRGKAIKRKMSIIKRKRALSMRRPPSPEKMERGVKKAVRMIGFAVKDKSGKYKDASPGEKERIEKRVSTWVKKFGGKFEKRIKPKTMKKMRDAYRARQKGTQVKTVNTAKLAARMKSGSIIGESNETY
jgi:hypothetical protein